MSKKGKARKLEAKKSREDQMLFDISSDWWQEEHPLPWPDHDYDRGRVRRWWQHG